VAKRKATKAKRLIVIADMHCGHRAGLTPPDWQWCGVKGAGEHENASWRKWEESQKECWEWYADEAWGTGPVDAVVVNGDCIDGRGERSGGLEQIHADRLRQCDMAAACINIWEAPQVFVVRGTPYHVGDKEDYENLVASKVRESGSVVKVGDHEWPKLVVGKHEVTFDCKHFVGGSSIPHGRSTAAKRDMLWNLIWADAGLQPKGDVIIRSHVHYYDSSTTFYGPRRIEALTTPALQTHGSKYGARRCSGMVNYGFLEFVLTPEGDLDKIEHIANLPLQAAAAVAV